MRAIRQPACSDAVKSHVLLEQKSGGGVEACSAEKRCTRCTTFLTYVPDGEAGIKAKYKLVKEAPPPKPKVAGKRGAGAAGGRAPGNDEVLTRDMDALELQVETLAIQLATERRTSAAIKSAVEPIVSQLPHLCVPP